MEYNFEMDINKLQYDYEMSIAEPYFSLILNKIKPVEGRKMSPTWIKLVPGNILLITCPGKYPFYAEITKINYYPKNSGEFDPLTNYLICEGLNQALPGVKTLTEARNIYLQWSSLDEINSYGMMGIHLNPII